ncbi:breast cancer type 1 protein [Aphelenchoides avenae]|nr:breast cancer type 1 protein [Aphelenchus avenae]
MYSSQLQTADGTKNALRVIEAAKAIKKLLQCPICLSTVDKLNPLLTSCGHLFCKGCLTKAEKAMGSVSCPICMKKTTRRSNKESDHIMELVPAYYMLAAKIQGALALVQQKMDNPFFESQDVRTFGPCVPPRPALKPAEPQPGTSKEPEKVAFTDNEFKDLVAKRKGEMNASSNWEAIRNLFPSIEMMLRDDGLSVNYWSVDSSTPTIDLVGPNQQLALPQAPPKPIVHLGQSQQAAPPGPYDAPVDVRIGFSQPVLKPINCVRARFESRLAITDKDPDVLPRPKNAQKPTVCLYAAGRDLSQIEVSIRRFVGFFGANMKVAKDLSPAVTHVVLFDANAERICPESSIIPYAYGVARGAHIVHYYWLDDAVQLRSLPDEKEYRILGNCYNAHEPDSSITDMFLTRSFFIDESFDSDELSKDQLRDIISACGGVVDDWTPDAEPLSGWDVVICAESSEKRSRRKKPSNVTYVTAAWVLDCILYGQIRDVDDYVVTARSSGRKRARS